MFYRYRRKFATWRFNNAIKAIHETPPMEVVAAPLSIVSMVKTRDVPMYLLSMKAFYRRIGRGKLIAIIDRDTPQPARDMLQRHFPGIAFEILEDIDTGPCQRGGTWERILYVLDRSTEEYVVQVDCDTLPLSEDLHEVTDCIRAGIAFTMADGFSIQSMPEAAAAAKQTDGDYIGIVTERLFDRYPGHERLRYVRGSSGFAGFSKGGFTRSQMEDFHRHMEDLVGKTRWREWGTEQCASNFAVANSPGGITLPYPAYASFSPGGPREEAKFFHFIGSYRFDEGFFARHGRAEIEKINASQRTRSAAASGERPLVAADAR
jgi:hypothetical protein